MLQLASCGEQPCDLGQAWQARGVGRSAHDADVPGKVPADRLYRQGCGGKSVCMYTCDNDIIDERSAIGTLHVSPRYSCLIVPGRDCLADASIMQIQSGVTAATCSVKPVEEPSVSHHCLAHSKHSKHFTVME